MGARARLVLQPFPGGLPTAQQLDAVVPDRPAVHVAYDGHTAWVNTQGAAAGRDHGRRRPNPTQRDHREGPEDRRADRGAEGSGAAAGAQACCPADARRQAATRSAPPSARRTGSASRACRTPSGSAEDLALYDELRQAGRAAAARLLGALGRRRASPRPTPTDSTRCASSYPDDPLFKTGAIKLMSTASSRRTRPRCSRRTRTRRRPATRTSRRRSSSRDRHAVRPAGLADPRSTRSATARSAWRSTPTSSAASGQPGAGARPPPPHRAHRDDRSRPTSRASARSASSRRSSRSTAARRRARSRVVGRTSGPSARRAAGPTAASWRRGGREAFGSDWPVVTARPAVRAARRVHAHHARRAARRAAGTGRRRCRWPTAIDAYTSRRGLRVVRRAAQGPLAPGMLADIVILSTDIFAPRARVVSTPRWTRPSSTARSSTRASGDLP